VLVPLILAIRNRDSIVVASDSHGPSDGQLHFGQFMNVPGHAILLIAGNLEAVRGAIETMVLPKLTSTTSAASLAQLVQAALMLEVVPKLSQIPGRTEIIVAGIDPVRHIELPGIYYLDSAQDFRLTAQEQNIAAAGASAAVAEVLSARDLDSASTDELLDAAKECLTATKLRWPAALGPHQRFGVITKDHIHILDF
jgi:hypothetical protein